MKISIGLCLRAQSLDYHGETQHPIETEGPKHRPEFIDGASRPALESGEDLCAGGIGISFGHISSNWE